MSNKLAPSAAALSLSPSASRAPAFGHKSRGPKKEPVPDGRALREATRQIQEDRQQCGFTKTFALCPPDLRQLASSLRKDHDPKDVITVTVAIRHVLQHIRRSPMYCLHRFHRLLAAVSVIRRSWFASRLRFVIRIVTLTERWAALERSAPRRHGPLSRAALAASLDEKWSIDNEALNPIASLRGKGELWQPHMAPLLIKRAVILAQYKRMKDAFVPRWRKWREKNGSRQANGGAAAYSLRRPGTASESIVGDTSRTRTRMSLVKVEDAFSPASNAAFSSSSSSALPSNNLDPAALAGASAGEPSPTCPKKPSAAVVAARQGLLRRGRDPSEPRFPWYAVMHSLNLQQLIDLTLRTHRHEERQARTAEAEADAKANGIEEIAKQSHSQSFDPRRMSMSSASAAGVQTQSDSFRKEILTNAVDEYCAGIDRDWVAYGFEQEKRISSNRTSPSRPRSPSPGGGGGKTSSAHQQNQSHASAASTSSTFGPGGGGGHNNTSSANNMNASSSFMHDDDSSDSEAPPVGARAGGGGGPSAISGAGFAAGKGAARHHRSGEGEEELRRQRAARRRKQREEMTAAQRIEEMRNFPVLSRFFSWEERPRVSQAVRIRVSQKYHEKLLQSRKREIEQGKKCGQNVVTDHLCLHQLEPFREMDQMTKSMFMRGVRSPLDSYVDENDTAMRNKTMSKASRELAGAQELDRVLAIESPPPMRFAL